jgi:hypothetical protein
MSEGEPSYEPGLCKIFISELSDNIYFVFGFSELSNNVHKFRECMFRVLN